MTAPRPTLRCPGWPRNYVTPDRPERCGSERVAVAQRQGGRTRLVCLACGRHFWTRREVPAAPAPPPAPAGPPVGRMPGEA